MHPGAPANLWTARPSFESDLVLSLGTNCELTCNLRRFYGLERTGLFDWVITPLACLPELIRSRFALVDDDFEASLVRVELSATDSIMHAPTGILLHHAFSRDENHRLWEGWRSEIGAVAEKFRFLGARMDRWLRDAERPALFLNRSGLHDACNGAASDDVYYRIIYAVYDAYPRASPAFCLINALRHAAVRVRHRADVRFGDYVARGDWREGQDGHCGQCMTGWREALSSLHVSLAHDGHVYEPQLRTPPLRQLASGRARPS